MFEKCFDSEIGKLDKLFESEPFSFGYMRDLHELTEETLRQHMALDLATVVELEKQYAVITESVTKALDSNPLYQTYKGFNDLFMEAKAGDPDWRDKFDDYVEAKEVCENDPDCFIYIWEHPDLIALEKQNPETDLFIAFGDEANQIMEGRDWTSLLGEDFKVVEGLEDDFTATFFENPEQSCATYGDADPEMSDEENKKAKWECDREWLTYWLSKFEEQKKAATVESLKTFEGSAREICNTRGLYE
jgi:hypothetical protein